MSFCLMARCQRVITSTSSHIRPATYEGNSTLSKHTCCAHFKILHRDDSEKRKYQLQGVISLSCRFRYSFFSATVTANVLHSGQSKSYGTRQGIHVEPGMPPSSSCSDRSVEVNAVIADVKYKLRHRTVNIDLLSPIVELLLDRGFKKEHIIAAMTTNTQLMSQNRHLWECTINNLAEYGFSKEHILPVVLGCPPLLKGKMDTLSTVLETLYSLYIPSDKANELVALCPEILQMKPKLIIHRFSLLLELFRKADITDLLLTNPSLLIDEWSDIMDRFNYVYFRLGFEQQVMRKCQVLSRSLEHITLRHLFLERAGLFEKPDKQGVTTITNARLKQIVDTTDHNFAINVAGMTLAEFRVFEEMLKLEREHDSLADEWDSDDDDDDDDDDGGK